MNLKSTFKNNFQNISNSFFYLFIFVLPWQTVYFLRETFLDGEKWHYGVIGIYLNLFFLMSWVCLELYLQRKTLLKTLKDYNKTFLSTLIFLSTVGLSIFQGDDRVLSSYFFAITFLGILAFWLIKNSKLEIKQIIIVFTIAASIQGIFALSQFILQGSFSNKWLGLEEHKAWQGGTAVIEDVNGRWLRAYGSFSHPNILGGYLFLSSILTLGGYLFFSKNKKEKIFFLVSLMIIFVGLIVSFSRSAWLAFVSTNILLFLYFLFKKNFKYCKRIILVLSGLLLIFFLIFFCYQSLFISRIKTQSRLEKKSISERVELVNESKEIIKKNWLFGVGVGNYTLVSYKNDSEKRPIWQHQPVHNIYLLMWSELGILGLLSFVFLMFIVIFKFLNFLRFTKNYFEIFALTSLCGLLVIGLFDHWIYSFYFGIITFWILFGLLFKSGMSLTNDNVIPGYQ